MPTEQYDQATRVRALQNLGVSVPGDFEAIQRAPHPQALELLNTLKVKSRKNYRLLCVQLHPDHNGGDETKTAWFKVVTYVYQWLCTLEVRPAPSPMPMFIPMPTVTTVNGVRVVTVHVGFRRV